MQNPFFVPPGRVTLTLGQINAIAQTVRNFFNANAATQEITDAQIIALAPEFSTVPGLLQAVKTIVVIAS